MDSDKFGSLPNIERALKIEVEKSGDTFRADAKALPGSPTVGVGKTEADAKYDLLVNLLYHVVRKNYNNANGLKGRLGEYGDTISDLINDDWQRHI